MMLINSLNYQISRLPKPTAQSRHNGGIFYGIYLLAHPHKKFYMKKIIKLVAMLLFAGQIMAQTNKKEIPPPPPPPPPCVQISTISMPPPPPPPPVCKVIPPAPPPLPPYQKTKKKVPKPKFSQEIIGCLG